MSYIQSSDIQVFPSSKRPDYPNSRLLTEYNLVNIINRLVDTNKFVVTTNVTSMADDDEFIFNINGYLFVTLFGDIKEIVTTSWSAGTHRYVIANINLTTEATGSVASKLTELAVAEDPTPTSGVVVDAAGVVTGGGLDSLDIALGSIKFFRGVNFTLSDNKYIDDDSCLAILSVSKTGETYTYSVPDSSKLKFETNTVGTNRSVRIDDGILSST